ncbi:hypothetical protein [Pinisolibacter aquiterrae]|uniref:hypothetical protein n=1 Tax=Pinisolibacter aquiterrae TaxID=2815579 RepID=UPI001C3C279C|nr:hypothetical protein [Pinisolibacter aquiterrae]MBV5266238.1 hypothetical protein [Pinisolibacter aquiterrae]MCC8236326.1 hypothetical protein [Pinisolibacter aquiterrae]
MSFFNKKTLYGLVAAAFLLGAVGPAAAQGWHRPPPPRPGWGAPPPPMHRWRPPPRRHCWTQERRVRVMTPWGPRWQTRHVRVCR